MAEPTLSFQVADYIVLSAILVVSAAVGVYYACTGGRQRTAEEFLMANRTMNPIPVALSISVSFISAVTFLGITAEAYINGILIWLHAVALPMACLNAGLFFMPVFHRLKLTSANEYLELRFNKSTRLLGTALVSFNMFVYMGVVLYGPALALNQVTGLSLWGSVLGIGIVCTFYTTIGGLKAVIWTDVFQMVIMLSGLLAVIIKGSISIGGFSNVVQLAEERGRLHLFDMRTDVTVRHTFWGMTIGGAFMFTTIFGVNQAQVQRYLACDSKKTAYIALAIAAFVMFIILSSAVTAGLVMFAYYADCDPISTGVVGKKDQMMPYFTMELFSGIPGLPGLFLSAVFSAALSTISSGLSALAAVTAEDIIKPVWTDLSDERYTLISKIIAMGYGILTIGFAFLASVMGDVLKTAINFFGMIGGPALGLFSAGLFFPWVNWKGAWIGTGTGLLMSFWIGIGGQLYPTPYPQPPLSTSGCDVYNVTDSLLYVTETFMESTVESAITPSLGTTGHALTETPSSRPAIAALYTLSYTWYAVVAWLVTLVVANVVSLVTGPTDPKTLDPRLISPVVDAMYCCLPEKWKKPLRCGVGADYKNEGADYQKVAVRVEKEDDDELRIKEKTVNEDDVEAVDHQPIVITKF